MIEINDPEFAEFLLENNLLGRIIQGNDEATPAGVNETYEMIL